MSAPYYQLSDEAKLYTPHMALWDRAYGADKGTSHAFERWAGAGAGIVGYVGAYSTSTSLHSLNASFDVLLDCLRNMVS